MAKKAKYIDKIGLCIKYNDIDNNNISEKVKQ
jgi:hypothetical protein